MLPYVYMIFNFSTHFHKTPWLLRFTVNRENLGNTCKYGLVKRPIISLIYIEQNLHLPTQQMQQELQPLHHVNMCHSVYTDYLDNKIKIR